MQLHGTTVLCVRKHNQVALIADGQVTLGDAVVKSNANKLRKIGDNVIVGFAGSTADALALFQHLEGKLRISWTIATCLCRIGKAMENG